MAIGAGYATAKQVKEVSTEILIHWLMRGYRIDTQKARNDEQRIAKELEDRIGISAEKLLSLIND